MSEDIQIVIPHGMMGADKDYLIEAMLRAIGEHHSEPNEWAEKYGARVDNAVFMMRPFCWCEGDECPWCWEEEKHGPRAPNFHYKPTDFRVNWYKYIGRDMTMNRHVSIPECARILNDCLASKVTA